MHLHKFRKESLLLCLFHFLVRCCPFRPPRQVTQLLHRILSLYALLFICSSNFYLFFNFFLYAPPPVALTSALLLTNFFFTSNFKSFHTYILYICIKIFIISLHLYHKLAVQVDLALPQFPSKSNKI